MIEKTAKRKLACVATVFPFLYQAKIEQASENSRRAKEHVRGASLYSLFFALSQFRSLCVSFWKRLLRRLRENGWRRLRAQVKSFIN